LREERGYARVVDIATRVGVTKGTVSLSLGQLAERGLVRFDAARFPVLTPAGRRVAADVRGRYTIVLAFLTEVMGLAPERASAEACRWEHVVSHEVADRLLDLVRFSADSPELAKALDQFHTFHRKCSAEARCATCAVRGPVESYCAVVGLPQLPDRRD
jgi:Mn-dependent DtxR family transcriptional regulator